MNADVEHPALIGPMLRRVALIAFAIATAFAAMGASQSQAYYLLHPGTPPPWSQSLAWSGAQWYAWAALVPAVAWLAGTFRFGDGARWLPRGLLHLAFALCFAFTHLLLQTAILFAMPSGREFLGTFANGMFTLLATTLQWELLSYAIVLAAVHSLLYLQRAQTAVLAQREVETRAARAQLSALQRQMQPHFLFNALNALVSMQREDSPEQRYTIRLSELLRVLLESGDRNSASLADELRLVDAYLKVEQARLGVRLAVAVDVPANLGSTALPAFILQPLVENAITHGVARDPVGGEVRIGATQAGERITIEVVNVQRGAHAGAVSGAHGNGITLDNTRRRLQLMFGAAAAFEAAATPVGFRAALTLPVVAAEPAP